MGNNGGLLGTLANARSTEGRAAPCAAATAVKVADVAAPPSLGPSAALLLDCDALDSRMGGARGGSVTRGKSPSDGAA